TAGGSRDYDTFVILHSRALINTLLQKIRGKQNHNPQPGLLKTIQEQVIEEGFPEEVEARTKRQLLNY
ncbi:MAG: hypothetical protein EZS28_018630, partial [Streblomastix strix]